MSRVAGGVGGWSTCGWSVCLWFLELAVQRDVFGEGCLVMFASCLFDIVLVLGRSSPSTDYTGTTDNHSLQAACTSPTRNDAHVNHSHGELVPPRQPGGPTASASHVTVSLDEKLRPDT